MTQNNPTMFQISLKVLLKNNQGEALLLKVPPTSGHPKTYDLPGGKINQEEIKNDFGQLINREIQEETGDINYQLRPDPTAIGRYFFATGQKNLYLLFEAKYLKGKITISDEHIEFYWKKLTKTNYQKLLHPALHELMKNYFLWNKN